jgi:hypothetical protein
MVSKRFRSPMDRREFLGVGALAFGGMGIADAAAAESLPSGVKVVWDLDKAHRETTPTHERVSLNGLWRWLPAKGATESVPARYTSAWKPSPSRKALYVGDPAGKSHLEAAGLSLGDYTKDELLADRVLIVGPGGGKKLAGDTAEIGKWLKNGGRMLSIGLDEEDTRAFLPFQVEFKRHEHIAAYFELPGTKSLLAGVGPADVHCRDPRELPLVTGGATIFGDGVLAIGENANVVFCQLVPWQFDAQKSMNLKRTFRRSSCMVTRLAANMGVAESTPILARFRSPVDASKGDKRWLEGLYLDVPEEWDDPYRFFRW